MLKLKELRTEKHLLQKDVAAELKCTCSCISSWEKEITEPDINDLIHLADFFGCTVDYLIGREEEDGVVIISGNELSDDEASLIDKIRSLDPLNKELAYQYVDFLNERQK
ncbi:MAG: helix-turn-helix domain-containing protein [Christensenellales bacterium]